MVCALQKSVDRQLREAYEAFFDDRIGDTTWRSLKKFLLESGLDLDANNLSQYARLRKLYPKLSITPIEFRTLLVSFENNKRFLPESINGGEFVRLIRAWRIEPDISTIYRWFKQAGSKYNKSVFYPKEVIFSVLYRAVVWKFVKERK